MNDTETMTTTFSQSEFEAFVRESVRQEMKVLVRQMVREELAYLLKASLPPGGELWDNEGSDDPEGDEELLNEVLEQIEREKTNPATRIPWKQVKAELARAEAAGELPD
ncbi:MAG: DUF4148 domain-containing protein [Chloroflexaceae bacterium]|nr:DUF4148 domain-containing protein [Chloroflexaceae bacterium]